MSKLVKDLHAWRIAWVVTFGGVTPLGVLAVALAEWKEHRIPRGTLVEMLAGDVVIVALTCIYLLLDPPLPPLADDVPGRDTHPPVGEA